VKATARSQFPLAKAELVHNGKVIGVIDLESTELNYFTEYHERLLMMLASSVSLEVTKTLLFLDLNSSGVVKGCLEMM